MNKSIVLRGAAVAALGTLATSANAALDVTAATTVIADGVVAAGVIGVAYLGFVAIVKIWKRLGSAT